MGSTLEQLAESLVGFYDAQYSEYAKYNDPEKRVEPSNDGNGTLIYKKKFERLMVANEVPYIPLSVTLAEIRMKYATNDSEYEEALTAILFSWRCYIERQTRTVK